MTETFIINHKEFTKPELIVYAEEQVSRNDIPEWRKDLYAFIKIWLSDVETISINTSGSTGQAKKILFTKLQMIRSAQRTLKYFDIKPFNKALLCLSVNYIAGVMMVVRAFTGKLNLIISPSDDINISETIHFAAMVPLQVEKLLNSNAILCNYKKIIIGGTAISSQLSEKIIKEFNGKVWETYAMTETLTHVAVKEIVANSFNHPFQALPGVTFSKDVRDCLVIHDPMIQSESLITNDRIELLTETSFHLLGRADNVINSGGIKIQPEEIERVLMPYISGKYCISSISDNIFGEIVVLVVEKRANSNQLLDTINKIEKFHRPKRIIEIADIPVNANGKIDRMKVKLMIEQ